MLQRIKYRKCVRAGFAAILLCCALYCGKQAPVIPAIIFNSDTLTVDRVADYDPSIANDSVRLRAIAIRLVCAGHLPDSLTDSTAFLLAERLLLVTSVEWKPAAAALLLGASKGLVAMAGETTSCATIRSMADSLFKLSSGALHVPAAPGWQLLACDSVDLPQPAGKAWLLRTILLVTPEVAGLLADFAGMSQSAPDADSTDLKNMVAGLVSTPESIRREEMRRKAAEAKNASTAVPSTTPAQESDNSAEALRFRDQNSIRDSIEKHIPDLKQLYKKILKTNSSLAGKVVVTIRVDAAGSIINARIKLSEIDNKAFLDPFVMYVRTIRFKPIPEKVGAMTFDFPFEFNPEM
jgi:TonB family protein